MPYTQKQRRAAFAALAKKKAGKKTKAFKGMSEKELSTYAHSPMHKKGKKK